MDNVEIIKYQETLQKITLYTTDVAQDSINNLLQIHSSERAKSHH